MIKKITDGFTIVETMIVLAIAGLIILIVLLAVPALQRSSYNTNMKTDGSAIAAAISDFEGNNGGSIPGSGDFPSNPSSSGVYTIGGGGTGTITSTAKIQSSDKVIYQTTAPSTEPNLVTIVVVSGIGCDGTVNPRTVSVYYPVEVAGSSSAQYGKSDCIE